MTISSIEKEFDEYLGEIIPREEWGIFRYEIVKSFYRQKIEELLDEIPTIENCNIGFDYDDYGLLDKIIDFKAQAKK